MDRLSNKDQHGRWRHRPGKLLPGFVPPWNGHHKPEMSIVQISPVTGKQLVMVLVAALGLCIFSFHAYGQRFGNEWINYSQTYFKLSVAEDGIYKLDYNTLLQAGFPVSNVDPRRMQLFFRGKEQAIMVQGQQDARFDAQDYLVFYGQRNDGAPETALYITPEAQPHPYYNLYSDTASYFLTWRLDGVNGKRMATFSENNVDGLPAEAYHLEEKLLLLTNEYSQGRQYPIGSSLSNHLSDFDYGEGWTGPRIQQGNSVDYTIPADMQFSTGPKPQLEIMLTGRNNQPHQVSVRIGSSNSTLRSLEDISFSYYDNAKVSQTIEWSDITGPQGGNGQLIVRITPQGVDGRADNVSVAYIKLTYPQTTDAGQENSKVFYLKASELGGNPQGKSFVSITNVPVAPLLLDVTNPDDIVNIGFNQANGKLNAIVPGTDTGRKLFLGSYLSNMAVKKVSFSKIDVAANFLIVSHAQMHLAAGQYVDPVKAYADYRSSASGGGYQTLVVNMQQLIDQFNYGIISPLAIRHFADYMLTQGKPEYLLLIGKGLTVNYNYYRKDPTQATLHDFVMTGGLPGSDVVLTAGLAGSDIHAAIPTGRINARNPADVAAYLDKVKDQEGRSPSLDYNTTDTRESLWKKHLVHLSGGVTVNELKLFSIYVDQFEDQATGNYLGGQVSTLSKTTNNATELINIADEVNKGLSLITFFGHSSTIRTDIEIGYVSNDELGYHNKGKYPTILINGCNAGNIFSSAFTFGEDWIATPNKGALNVLAHSAEGLSNILKLYSNNFYETAFEDSTWIDASLGRIKTEAGKRFIGIFNGTNNEIHTVQVQQMILQGDPGIRLFGKNKIDYSTNANSLSVQSLNDQPVTAYSDSFAIDIIVRNYGIATSDSLRVSVNRTLTSGKVVSYGPMALPAVAYEDTLRFVVNAGEGDLQKAEGYGINRFEVVLDSPDSLDELNDNNNRATIEYNMPLGGTVNLLPHDFAIVNQPNILLQVQPGNLQGALEEQQPRTFLFEADTSALFDSPVKVQFSKDAVSLATWPLALPIVQDSTVYYWRTKFAEPREGEIDSWSQYSFTYISNSSKGWAQLKPTQLKQNSTAQLSNDNGQWSFEETSIEIDMTTYGGNEPISYPQLSISGKQFLFTTVSAIKCRDNSINGVAFEKESLRPYLGIPPNGFDDLDPNNCGPLPQVINTLSNSQVSTQGMLEKYIDGVKEGDAVLLFSIGTVEFESWQAVTLEKLQEIGVSLGDIANLQNGEPMIILGKKGSAPGSATILRAAADGGLPVTEQQISLQEKISSRYSEDSIISRRIGPASSWTALQYHITAVESTDEVTLQVMAESLSGVQTVLYENIAGVATPGVATPGVATPETPNVDLSQVDAAQYPYLQLKLSVKDETNFTPAQLRKWLVSYSGVPEGVILMSADQDTKLSLQEGQAAEAVFSFYNVADVAFSDSLSVAYAFDNQENRQTDADTFKIAPVAGGDTVTFQIPVGTLGKTGTNDLRVYVNPSIVREQSYDNNQIRLADFLTVKADETHPVIDVAFNGIYIMDGDIVAPDPLITMELRDENPYLLKQDTTGIDIYLSKVEVEETVSTENARTMSGQRKRIDLTSPQVSWTPATEDQPFKINYQPEPLEDGIYTLSVQASDASGNASGAAPYAVNFEVINASAITNFYPYPNPFSTSTRFVFTLTGSEIPEQLKIQIMTVSGKIVHEITQDEIGPLRIGNNITSYAWDGRDEFGDELANGVYLYRVVVRRNGKEIDHRETSADKAFKHGFGKLYILR